MRTIAFLGLQVQGFNVGSLEAFRASYRENFAVAISVAIGVLADVERTYRIGRS